MTEYEKQSQKVKESVERGAMNLDGKNRKKMSQTSDLELNGKKIATNIKTNNNKYQVSPKSNDSSEEIKTVSKNVSSVAQQTASTSAKTPPTFNQIFWFPSNKDTAIEVEKAKLIIETPDGKFEFYEFIIESVRISDKETVDLFKAFNMSIVQSFGRQMKTCAITLTLPHNDLRAWYGNFNYFYDNQMRATRQIGDHNKITLSIDKDLYGIIPISFSVYRPSAEKYSVTANLEAYITTLTLTNNAEKLLVESFVNGTPIQKDNSEYENLPSSIKNTVTNPIKDVIIDDSKKIDKKFKEGDMVAKIQKKPVYPSKIESNELEEMNIA